MAVFVSIPSPFLLKRFTRAALNAAPTKSTFFSKLTEEGIIDLRGSNEACDNKTLLSKFNEAVTMLSNLVL